MPVKIRLMRIGTKKRPFYRVVAVNEQKKRTGAYLELLGTYNPLTQPKEIILKQDRIDAWVKNGAQPSDGFLRIIGKLPQKPPRKPKKEKKVETAPAVPAPAPAEQKPAEETAEKVAPEEVAEAGPAEAEAPVESETSLNEAPAAERAAEAAEVLKKAEDSTLENKPKKK